MPLQDTFMKTVSLLSPLVDFTQTTPTSTGACIEFAYMINHYPSFTLDHHEPETISVYISEETQTPNYQLLKEVTTTVIWGVARVQTSLLKFVFKLDMTLDNYWYHYGIDNIKVTPGQCAQITGEYYTGKF